MEQGRVVANEVEGGTRPLEARSRAVSPFPAVVASLITVNAIVFFLLPVAFPSRFPYRRDSLGVLWGPLVFSGEWWRALTWSFVHFDFLHLFPNMLVLWVLGLRMERELGKCIFLFFYLACGLIVALTLLTWHPYAASLGASGAVCGVAGGVIVSYAPRVRSVSWSTRAKLGSLILFTGGLVATEFARGGLYLAHTTGLLAGMILCLFLIYVAKTQRGRYWTFALLAALLVTAATFIQRYH